MRDTAHQVLKMAPSDLLVWVREQLTRATAGDRAFNWHGLAQAAASNARSPDASPAWAQVAAEVYASLAGRDDAPADEAFKRAEMYVRAHQIRLHGADPANDLQNAGVLLQ
jgi:hypothetical protein